MNAETHTSFILIERHASKVAPSLRRPLKKRPGLRKNLSDGVEELAEKAWRSVNKEIAVGGVTVTVRGFSRYREAGGATEKAASGKTAFIFRRGER